MSDEEFSISQFVESLYKWGVTHKYINPQKISQNDLESKTNKFICYQQHDKTQAIKLFPNAKNPVIVSTVIKLWFPDIYISILNKNSTPDDYHNIDQIIDDLWIN